MKRIIKIAFASIFSLLTINSSAYPIKSNIGGRTILCQETSKEYVPASAYVQEGLIAMWDAIENVDWGIHDSSATTWKDLIGSNDLLCPPRANGYFTKDGWH